MPVDGQIAERLRTFIACLRKEGFTGDVMDDIGTRTVMAIDNSVYELPPLVVVCPRVPDDLNQIAKAASFSNLPIAARGGGTGTNGQSLTAGICVDCSRYLTEIEEINTQEGYAIVQPGVILDQLNRAAGQHGLFFAPTVSTASRATLGGMAATDAAGKGSRIYGRTSDHVMDMDVVLADGSDMRAMQLGSIGATIAEMLAPVAPEIDRVFPIMNRGLTGYNLKDAAQGSVIKLLCGSEGTLALTKRLKLRLLPRPKARGLAVFAYSDIMIALRDVQRLAGTKPAAIEFIDDKIMMLAQQDPVWASIANVLGNTGKGEVKGLNFVEVIGDTWEEMVKGLKRLQRLSNAPAALINARDVTEPGTVAELWQLRSKCVGLLGRMDPTLQGTPFVEDAAVPAEKMADFVDGFRTILDDEGLQYGMYGHADVGCVHVRPALDMRRPEDAAVIRRVSDKVNLLARRHGGLIWGEHGKGFRGEYVPQVFGPQLYKAMCEIKALFDPKGLLNPGKLASPDPAQPLTPLDAVPFRGPRDAVISPELTADFEAAIRCNGNGLCMGRDFDDAMCPSYKATGDRRRGPKGRAAMLRLWARYRSEQIEGARLAALEAALIESLSDCLGCKACASQCPIKVDIPQMRGRFYASYYGRHARPLSHRLLAMLEPLGPVLRAAPRLSNAALTLSAPGLRAAGLVDFPAIQPVSNLSSRRGRRGKVVLIADSFLSTFDGKVLEAATEVLSILDYDVTVSKPIATGKPAHVIGAERAFAKIAAKALTYLRDLADSDAQLVAIEPSFLSMFSHEYEELELDVPPIVSLDRHLESAIKQTEIRPENNVLTLLTHCTETASDPKVAARWKAIFEKFGVRLETPRTGCCGMAGTFGHERAKQNMSRRLFDMSWKDKVASAKGEVIATGFSCRCQVKRMCGQRPVHPVESLRDLLKKK